MHDQILPVSPVEPPAPYLGGKRLLAARIINRLSQIPHHTYVEPFIGMGGVFLRRPFRAKSEVINDISTDVSNLFRILQRHYVPFMDMLRWQVSSRSDFERLVATNAETLTDLERAARFLYLQRLAFGGKVMNRSFGVSVATPGRFNITSLAPLLEDVHERLAGVVIERLHFTELIKQYDTPDTLFYLDPPYWNSEKDYGKAFDRDDFGKLAEQLASIQGTFVLSINDLPEVRQCFAAFDLTPIETSYTISGQSQRAGELLISPKGQLANRLI